MTARPLEGQSPSPQAPRPPQGPFPRRCPASVCSPVKWDCARVRAGRSRAPPPGVAPRPDWPLAAFHHPRRPAAPRGCCRHLLRARDSPPGSCSPARGRGAGESPGTLRGAGRTPPSLPGPSGGGASPSAVPTPGSPARILPCQPQWAPGGRTGRGPPQAGTPPSRRCPASASCLELGPSRAWRAHARGGWPVLAREAGWALSVGSPLAPHVVRGPSLASPRTGGQQTLATVWL